MRDKPFVVRPRPAAHAEIRALPSITERAKARQSLIDRTPFPGRFASRAVALEVATDAGPEFEVVVQS